MPKDNSQIVIITKEGTFRDKEKKDPYPPFEEVQCLYRFLIRKIVGILSKKSDYFILDADLYGMSAHVGERNYLDINCIIDDINNACNTSKSKYEPLSSDRIEQMRAGSRLFFPKPVHQTRFFSCVQDTPDPRMERIKFIQEFLGAEYNGIKTVCSRFAILKNTLPQNQFEEAINDAFSIQPSILFTGLKATLGM
jgi:hypothetical protein